MTLTLTLTDAARELLEHLEEFCEFPQNSHERKLSKQLYAAIEKAEKAAKRAEAKRVRHAPHPAPCDEHGATL